MRIGKCEPFSEAAYAERLMLFLADVKLRRGIYPSEADLKDGLGCSSATLARARADLIRRRVLVIEAEAGRVKRWSLQLELFDGAGGRS